MTKVHTLVACLSCLVPLVTQAQEGNMISLEAGPLRVGVTGAGRLSSLLFIPTNAECLATDRTAPLLSLTVAGRELQASALQYDAASSVLRLSYGDDGPVARIRVAPQAGPSAVWRCGHGQDRCLGRVAGRSAPA